MSTTTDTSPSEAQYQSDEAAAEAVGQDAERFSAAQPALDAAQLRMITELGRRQESIDTRLDQVMHAILDAEQLRQERDAARAELVAVRQQAVDPEKTFALYAALAQFQAKLPKIVKNATADVQGKEGKRGYKYGYADLAEVSEKILPALGACGLAWITMPRIDPRQGIFLLRWMLVHKDGGTLWGDVPLPDPSRVAAQAFGSDLTYLRRYLLLSVTGCFPAGEDTSPPFVDDDGNRSASGTVTGGFADGPVAPSAPPAPRSRPAKAAGQGPAPQPANSTQRPAEGQGSIAGTPMDEAKKRATEVVARRHLSWGDFADQFKRHVGDEDARWQAADPVVLNAFLDTVDRDPAS